MVYGRVGYCSLSCLLYILLSLCSDCWVLAWVVTGKDCLLVAYAMKMILLYLPHQFMHSEECWRYALSFLLKGIWCSMPGRLNWYVFANTDLLWLMTALNFVGRNCAFLIRSATWATFCHATYLIHLILKTKPKSLLGVPTASSWTLECALLL